MKKTVILLVAMVLLSAVPVFAQGPFTDVPTDHWAYDAVNQLQRDGILIGYPDGTFAGKRSITRYEFAVAIARMLGNLPATGISKAEVEQMLNDYAKKSELPTVPANLATKADVDALRKLIDEFRDELAALGVDVDALKRDVAALSARVDALEAEQRRFRAFGDVTVFGISGATRQGNAAIDLDQRVLRQTLVRDITVVKDFDLKVVGRVSESTTANATINYGNYLNYLGAVDDYVSGVRPAGKNEDSGAFGFAKRFTDVFFPYYLYVDAGMGKGAFTAGRFPIQFTPYTLKMIDVDSYTNIMKTSDGNYPVDGAKLAMGFGGVDLTLFAAKHDENDYLANGLTAQPRAGLYNPRPGTGLAPLSFHDAGGFAVGGLGSASQTAGARLSLGTPFNGVLGATYYQSWDRSAYYTLANYDQARVFGADLAIPVPFLFNSNLTGSWTQSDTLARDGAAVSDITDNNTAWDAKLNFGFGKLGFGAGYKSIERNFAAAGAWDKIGRWTNPTDVQGPYADLVYPFGDNLKVVLNGEFLKVKDTLPGTMVARLGGFGVEDDTIIKAEGALRWGFSAKNALDVSYQWVKFDPDTTLDAATEKYLTVGWAYQMNPNAAFKVGYQFINFNGGDDAIVYGPYERGNLGVVQFGVSF